MKKLIWIGAALLLVACGADEPAEQPAAEPAVEEEVAVPAAEAPAEVPAEEEAGEEAVEVVEESAAEPEPEEQQILLAEPESSPPVPEWKFTEGRHYHRIVPAQPTMGGADKIEVAEFFYYACPHCDNFEPIIKEWASDIPTNVRFVQIPAMWNGMLQLHARMFFTKEVLARNGTIEDGDVVQFAIFDSIHRRGNRLTSEASIQRFMERFGVSAEQFESAWNSFEVDQKMRIADDLGRRYSVASTPTMVVNGKYRTGGAEAGSFGALLEVIDELIARESLR